MATKRRRFTAKFKTRVVMEAFRGDRTVQAIAAKHEVHPNQVSVWKRQAQGAYRYAVESGMVRGHHLHPGAGRVPVPGVAPAIW